MTPFLAVYALSWMLVVSFILGWSWPGAIAIVFTFTLAVFVGTAAQRWIASWNIAPIKSKLRTELLLWLIAMGKLIARWVGRIDLCHICGEPASYWCVYCNLRHCSEHQSLFYHDCDSCTHCHPVKQPALSNYR